MRQKGCRKRSACTSLGTTARQELCASVKSCQRLQAQVIEDMDAYMLADNGILLEDLPLGKLQQFLEDPSAFKKDSEALQATRKQLYGLGRMPILTAEAEASHGRLQK